MYTGGPGAHEHAVVTQWLRPSQMANVTSPMLFKNDFEVEGIIQGEGTTNRWLLSALNIIGGNREQLDRVFMEHDEAQGFFICKFYQDDPLSGRLAGDPRRRPHPVRRRRRAVLRALQGGRNSMAQFTSHRNSPYSPRSSLSTGRQRLLAMIVEKAFASTSAATTGWQRRR